MKLLYIVVRIESADELDRLRKAVGRPWLPAGSLPGGSLVVRYWVPSQTAADRERAVLFLAGFSSQIEGLDPSA